MKTPDKKKWGKAVKEEHDRMVKMNVWEAKKNTGIPNNVKLSTSTWAIKKKSNGIFRGRVNARGFMQESAEHFNSDCISSPVANEATIRVVMVLYIMFGWANQLVDGKGAFLCGNFQAEKPNCMKVPEGFKSYYAEVLKLMESMNLRVKFPMILEVDNKGAVDLINNYSVGGRTRHMETRQYYLRELKEKNIMVVKWKAGAENSSDMFTKNLPKKEFNKHAAVYVGSDEYMVQV